MEQNYAGLEKQQLLEKLIDTTGTALRVIDSNLNVIYQNDMMKEMTGISDEEIENSKIKCYDQLSGRACHSKDCTLRQLRGQGEEEVNIEIEKTTPDGTEIPTLLTSKPIRNEKGEVVAIAESFKDISDVKNTVNRIKQVSQKVSKGDLTAEIETSDMERDYKELAKSVNQITRSLRETINQIRESSESVSETAQDLASAGEQMDSSTEEVSQAIQDIAEGAQTQSEKIAESLTLPRTPQKQAIASLNRQRG